MWQKYEHTWNNFSESDNEPDFYNRVCFPFQTWALMYGSFFAEMCG